MKHLSEYFNEIVKAEKLAEHVLFMLKDTQSTIELHRAGGFDISHKKIFDIWYELENAIETQKQLWLNIRDISAQEMMDKINENDIN